MQGIQRTDYGDRAGTTTEALFQTTDIYHIANLYMSSEE